MIASAQGDARGCANKRGPEKVKPSAREITLTIGQQSLSTTYERCASHHTMTGLAPMGRGQREADA